MGERVLQGVRVLLLEDDAMINLATTDMIEEMGCLVTSFMSLEPAFAAIRQEAPHIAVLDVKIQTSLSYELAQELHQRGVPIVFLTGYDSPALEEKWRSFPICTKPCEPAELKLLLIKALSTGQDVKG